MVSKWCLDDSPKAMDCPGIVGPNCGVNIPELRLEHLAARIVEAAGILAMELGLATDFRSRT